MNYVPLYIKTNYSLLSSMIKIDDLILYAKKNNLKVLTITDNNMYGVMEFYNACLKASIKPIIGLEITYQDQIIILYCKNETGYHCLCKLATIASDRLLTRADLEVTSDLIAIVPHKSLAIVEDIKLLFADLFVGYDSLMQKEVSSEYKYVYMRETLYLEESEKDYLKYLTAIKNGLLDPLSPNNHLVKEQDVLGDLNNNYKINELCNLTITKQPDLLPIYPCPSGMDSYAYLKDKCQDGLRRLFGNRVSKVYVDRLKYELDVINKMGFCNYFLVVADYVDFARNQQILVGPGRGSAAGSLVAYCLNITEVDPIKYNLLFERFLNPERISMPDIDIDFEDARREEVINYCVNKYGLKKVVGIITFGTMAAKQVVRDVGRVMNIDIKTIDYLTKMLDSHQSLKDNYLNNKKLTEYLEHDHELKELYKVATKLEGLKRHTSVHAAGIVMSSKDIDEIIPIVKNNDHFYTTAYSMEYLENLGLLKMDFLGLRNLTLISDVVGELKKDNIIVDLKQLPVDDQKTLNIFESVNTVGIFQFESSGMMNFLRKLKASTFEDVAAAVALFRPGPMDNIDLYIRRKHNLEEINYFHPNLKPILEPTYGVIIYQEQIMQIATTMAGYTLGEADVLRRAMSKKKEAVLLQEKEKFIAQSIKLGYSLEVASEVFNLILKFAAYGFNRAHAVAYSMIAYQMAYLKAHYPKYFMKSLLSMVIGSEVKTKEYIYECRLNNINILKPDIGISKAYYTIEELGIRYPLSNIKGLGSTAVKAILDERDKNKFVDIYDFVRRTYGKSVNRKTLTALNDAGCFVSFGINHHTLEANLDAIINYAEIAVDETVSKPQLVFHEEYEKKELMKRELESFGFYLNNHPITDAKLKVKNTVAIKDLNQYFNKQVNLLVMIDRLKVVKTKKNDEMLFITGSDEMDTVDLVLFPSFYKEAPQLELNDVVLVSGKIEKRFDKYQVIVNEITVVL